MPRIIFQLGLSERRLRGGRPVDRHVVAKDEAALVDLIEAAQLGLHVGGVHGSVSLGPVSEEAPRGKLGLLGRYSFGSKLRGNRANLRRRQIFVPFDRLEFC